MSSNLNDIKNNLNTLIEKYNSIQIFNNAKLNSNLNTISDLSDTDANLLNIYYTTLEFINNINSTLYCSSYSKFHIQVENNERNNNILSLLFEALQVREQITNYDPPRLRRLLITSNPWSFPKS